MSVYANLHFCRTERLVAKQDVSLKPRHLCLVFEDQESTNHVAFSFETFAEMDAFVANVAAARDRAKAELAELEAKQEVAP